MTARAAVIGVPDVAPTNGRSGAAAPPARRPLDAWRGSLVDRLQTSAENIVKVVAPLGYGKSTLVSQWVDADARASRWLSVDRGCNDALEFASRLYLTLGLPGEHVSGRASRFEATSRCVRDVAAAGASMILVLDDVHLLTDPGSLHLLRELIEAWPSSGCVVLLGDRDVSLPLAEARVAGQLLEIGPDELRFDANEAKLLLASLGAGNLSHQDIGDIVEAAEGWALGVVLVAGSRRAAPHLPLAGPPPSVVAHFTATLDALPDEVQRFLIETAIVEELSGSLCDAVLHVSGSGARLEELDRAGLMLVPLDHRRERYRHHRMFRGVLLQALAERMPAMVPTLIARAVEWYEKHGMVDRAVDIAMAGDQVGLVAGLLARHGLQILERGGFRSLGSWLAWFEHHAPVDRYPRAAAVGALCMAIEGDARGAHRWLATTSRSLDPDEEIEAVRLLASALLCSDGAAQMERDARRAAELLPPGSPFAPVADLVGGIADGLFARTQAASEAFMLAARRAREASMRLTESMACSNLALLQLAAGDLEAVRSWVRRARLAVDAGDLRDHPSSALTGAVEARVELSTGSCGSASVHHARASQRAPAWSGGPPALVIQTNLMLAVCALGLGEAGAAEGWLVEAEALAAHRDVGVLTEACVGLRREFALLRAGGQGPPSFTPAEVRLIPDLATQASFRAIGERLFVSPHTVKTQAISIYRKLGVSSRTDAVEHMRRLGLLVPQAG